MCVCVRGNNERREGVKLEGFEREERKSEEGESDMVVGEIV
jgi:hypothetical protein